MSSHMIILRGLPGSGKSTWAENYKQRNNDNNNIEIISINTIRKNTFSDKKLNYEENALIHKYEEKAIVKALASNKLVIVDSMNIRNQNVNRLVYIAKNNKASYEIKNFSLDLNTIIERNKNCKNPFDEKTLITLYNKFTDNGSIREFRQYADKNEISTPMLPYKIDNKKPKAIIVDIDGTIALKGERNPYDTARYIEDIVNEPINFIIQALSKQNTTIIYCTSRSEDDREITQAWLNKYNFPKGNLIMRVSGDYRNDALVKYDLFDKYIRQEYNIISVFDDRDNAVNMWRQIGLTCCQVAPGNF